MSAAYVRGYYGLTCKRGQRVTVKGRPGVIVSFPGQYIGVRFDGEKFTTPCHPTWEVDYDPKENAAQAEGARDAHTTAV